MADLLRKVDGRIKFAGNNKHEMGDGSAVLVLDIAQLTAEPFVERREDLFSLAA